jgi:hypothetical protein
MTAKVTINKINNGVIEISLHKNGTKIKSFSLFQAEWEDLLDQIAGSFVARDTRGPYNDPILVVIAKYRRLHNAGCNCTPLAALLEVIEQIREDPDEFVRKEKLEQMMEIVVRKRP